MFNILKRKNIKKEPIKYHRFVIKCIDCGEELILITEGVQCISKLTSKYKNIKDKKKC